MKHLVKYLAPVILALAMQLATTRCAFAVTSEQAAIIAATTSSLTPGDSSPDRPVVLEISTSGAYALVRWMWGIAAGDALLVSKAVAWHSIEATTGSYDANGLENYYQVPAKVADALVDPHNRVTVAQIPKGDVEDRLAGKLGCGYAFQTYYRLNFPPGTTTEATEIVHADVLLYQGDGIGWLLRTRNDAQFYADGPINQPRHHNAPRDVAIGILTALVPKYNASSAPNPQEGALYPVTQNPDLSGFPAMGIQVRTCY